ncbi:MAG: hypothetical protein U0359_01425 [Byssovorax sp.]
MSIRARASPPPPPRQGEDPRRLHLRHHQARRYPDLRQSEAPPPGRRAPRRDLTASRNELLAAAKPSDEGKVVLDYPLPVGDTQVVVKVGDQQQILTLDKNHSASASFE